MNDDKAVFFDFIDTIATLRGENGCPWDKKQTLDSLKKYLLQECEELLEAIDNKDPDHICEETGDVYFILTLISQINTESGHFNIYDVINGINKKMIRRHPHVFSNMSTGSDEELRKQWEDIKSLEKKKKTN